eukprot:2894575-Pleurochrysis_carterae.AAC.2
MRSNARAIVRTRTCAQTTTYDQVGYVRGGESERERERERECESEREGERESERGRASERGREQEQ